MNEAALLAACDAVPADPVRQLILADCLEEAGTPGRTAVARLVRRSAKALQTGTPAAQGVLTREKNRLSKSRPCAVAWFEWWFADTVSAIIELHKALDRRKLALFVVRCARETTSPLGGRVAEHLNTEGRLLLSLLARFAAGRELTEADWRRAEAVVPPTLRLHWRTYVTHAVYVGLGNVGEALDADVLALADPAVPVAVARWAAVSGASGCAGAFADSWDDQRPARELHRRLLHECVPCPFDAEGDG